MTLMAYGDDENWTRISTPKRVKGQNDPGTMGVQGGQPVGKGTSVKAMVRTKQPLTRKPTGPSAAGAYSDPNSKEMYNRRRKA